jgi:hypothetical protein
MRSNGDQATVPSEEDELGTSEVSFFFLSALVFGTFMELCG